MSEYMKYPNNVPADERPEVSIGNVPNETIKKALAFAVTYGECPTCETRQFLTMFPGHHHEWDCIECGETLVV